MIEPEDNELAERMAEFVRERARAAFAHKEAKMKPSEQIYALQEHLDKTLTREWLWIVGDLQEIGVQSTQLEAEIVLKADYITRLETENERLTKRSKSD